MPGGVGVPKNTQSTPESEDLCGGSYPERTTVTLPEGPFLFFYYVSLATVEHIISF